MMVADLVLNLSFQDLERRFLLPYGKGEPLINKGKTVTRDNIRHLRIYSSGKYLGRTQYKPHRMTDVAVEITDELITGPPGHDLTDHPKDKNEVRPSASSREVFVVHGKNSAARAAMFSFLRSIDLHPLEWSEAVRSTGKPSPYIGDILDAAFARAHAVVALLTPDDEARLKPQFHTHGDPTHETDLTGQARQNVLFEVGMAMGRRPDRTVLVELGQLRPFSDVAGIHVIRMDDSSERRHELAIRLQIAGCPIDLSGTDWHKAGDFEDAITSSHQEVSESQRVLMQEEGVAHRIELSEDANWLLEEAASDRSRSIMKIRPAGGLLVNTNKKSFVELDDPRSEARWEQAIRDLVDYRLVEDAKGLDQVFEVTHLGFQYIDGLHTD